MACSYLPVVRLRLVAPLSTDELKRRIDAARTIRGLRQVDLAALVEEDGHGKYDVGRLERGDLSLTRALRRSLAEHLEVPERWFTDPELDLRTAESRTPVERLDRIERAITTLTEALTQASETGTRERATISRLLASQEKILEGLTKAVGKLTALLDQFPDEDALKIWNEGSQDVLAAAEALQAERAAAAKARGETPRRRATSG